MNFILKFIFWLLLNIFLLISMQLALFSQLTPEMDNASLMELTLNSEFWASIQWLFVIPVQRIGILFFTPPQLAMVSCVLNLVTQLFSNAFWLNLKTEIDDYVGMMAIFVGLAISKFRVFD
jgi:hypothetical protein